MGQFIIMNSFCLAQIPTKFPRLVFSSFGINFRPRTSLKDGGVKERMIRGETR